MNDWYSAHASDIANLIEQANALKAASIEIQHSTGTKVTVKWNRPGDHIVKAV